MKFKVEFELEYPGAVNALAIAEEVELNFKVDGAKVSEIKVTQLKIPAVLVAKVGPSTNHVMYYRVTKKNGEKFDFEIPHQEILNLIPPGRTRTLGDFRARCEALTRYVGFEVVDWELNDFPAVPTDSSQGR